MNLGAVIKDLRKKKHITQTELAASCQISQTYLSQIETNSKEPNISTLKTIAEKLDIPLPVMFFLALEDKDIPEGKRKAYEMLSPSVKSMLNTFFSDDKGR